MPVANLLEPPITQDVWTAIRDRIATATMATILGGTGRVFVEGDYSENPAGEAVPWGRAVVVPVLPLRAPRFVAGLGTPVGFLVRTDFNNIASGGLPASVWASRKGELAQREAFRRLQNWAGPISSTQVMIAMAVQQLEWWQSRVLWDQEKTGTVFLSSRYQLDVAQAVA